MSSNPYRAGNSVGATEAFVGREKILRDIREMINGLHHNTLVLYGQRRIGKTSILRELEEQLSDEYCVIFFDWQDKAQWPLRKVLEDLSFRLSDTFSQEKPTLTNDPGDMFKQWLCELLNPQNKPLVFLFDEFDVIAAAESADEITTYFARLLNLSPQHLNWIFVIGGKIEQLTSEAIARLFGKIESRFVSFLTLEETQELVRLSEKESSLQWQESAVKKVYQLTNGHPYFTQRLCSDVWVQLHPNTPSEKTPLVTPQNVSDNVSKTLEASHSILESLWLSLSIPERVVAAALAKKEWIELTKPLEQFSKKLQEARDSLIKWELIQEKKGSYRFSAEIIRRWIEKHKFPSYNEELDLIEPYAQEIYEIAKRLNEEKRSKNAFVLLEQALILNPYHTKAIELSAHLLKENRQFQQAQRKLESLYQYNPQAVQKDLVQVLLKLALSSDNEKEQLTLYQRVKEIEPNNVTAQHKVQEIEIRQQERKWRQRVKKFYQTYQKRILQVIGFTIGLVIPYYFWVENFPTTILLEIEQANDSSRYSLVGVPSSENYSLDSLQIIILNSSQLKKLPTFEYQHHQPIELAVIPNTRAQVYQVNKELLQKQLSKPITEFKYPYSTNKPLHFVFDFQFAEKSSSKVDFACQAATTDQTPVECQVKQIGYGSLLRGIPWWQIGTIFGIIFFMLIEFIFAWKNRERDDDF